MWFDHIISVRSAYTFLVKSYSELQLGPGVRNEPVIS